MEPLQHEAILSQGSMQTAYDVGPDTAILLGLYPYPFFSESSNKTLSL